MKVLEQSRPDAEMQSRIGAFRGSAVPHCRIQRFPDGIPQAQHRALLPSIFQLMLLESDGNLEMF